MNIYKLEKPAKWSAGKCGNESFYFSCAECGNEEIAGFIGNGPTFEEVAIIGNSFPYKPAMYCQICLTEKILKEQTILPSTIKEGE